MEKNVRTKINILTEYRFTAVSRSAQVTRDILSAKTIA